MRILTCAALAAAVAVSLCGGCAELSASLTPQNVSLGVSLLDHAICAEVGKNGLCSKKAQKAITNAASGAIDSALQPPAH